MFSALLGQDIRRAFTGPLVLCCCFFFFFFGGGGGDIVGYTVRNFVVPPAFMPTGIYYSFRLSVRMFFVRPSVRNSVTFVEFASKYCVKVSQVVYFSATTYQKVFIFGP